MDHFTLPTTRELPVLFLSHAAPVLLMTQDEKALGRNNDSHFTSDLANWYRNLPKQMNIVGQNKPFAIVQFSAHYETNTPTIKILAQDTYKGGLLYDYYGFPQHTYNHTYPCPGSAQLAKLMADMFNQSGFDTELNVERGIDHGGFIPLLLMYPEADIPVLQISIANNAVEQRKIAEILAPLRTRGIFFIGSGQATHGAFMPTQKDVDEQRIFIETLTKGLLVHPAVATTTKSMISIPAATSTTTVTIMTTTSAVPAQPTNQIISSASPDEIYRIRSQTVDNWTDIPGACYAHPHYDHYLPLVACVGLTKNSLNSHLEVAGDYWLMGIHSLRTFVFGEFPFERLTLDE